MTKESTPTIPSVLDCLEALSKGTTLSSATAMDLLLVDADGLGRMLKLGNPDRAGSAAKAVNERIYRKTAVPPGVMIPGSKKRLWLVPDVIAWLRQFEGQRGSTRTRRRKRRKSDDSAA